jgi:ribonuclease VapC
MLNALIDDSRISVQPVTVAQADLAREAHLTYGKGRHPARLNLGDCFAHALARDSGRPLLFKGGDFARTDREPALPAA